MNGLELFSKISTKKEYVWNENLHELIKSSKKQNNKQLKIIAFDYGVKSNILRNLYERNFEVSVLPYTTTIEEVISKKPDGIFLSNGPGDPKVSDPNVFKLLKNLTNLKIPIFGICIGHQLIALTLGAKTSKMKQGHRGANHPVKNLETNSVEITSQNHGFIVDKQSLPSDLQITHISLFDQSIEGLKHKDLPIFSVQFHPEASPGPTDTSYLFDKFYNLCLEYSNAKKN
jgi:carbamoyl-phosphate synthase small subunit